MKKKNVAGLFALAGALLCGTSLALQTGQAGLLPGFGAGTEQLVLAKEVDPRLVGLPAGPGSIPAGGAIERMALTDPQFAAGLALFDHAFHASEGVGAPEMNADSCRGCHQDPFIGGAGALELNVSRFGDDGGGTYTFQNLPGGQGLSKLFPAFVPGREEYDPTTATVFEQRQTPSILGGGLIDGIPDAVILANEDPYDADGNGIFGVARIVTINGVPEVGRFGWKAQAPRLRDFVMDAMGGELGITTPDDGRGFAMVSDNDTVPDPELSPKQVDDLAHFMENLPAPPKGDVAGPLAIQGEKVFKQIGCATCHIPALQGADGPVPLFSDLLLHNVMAPGYRGMAEPGADVGMFRTPPLWGIGTTAPYMHDGRAATLAEAIAAHDGEALGVRTAFQNLSVADRQAVLAFLRSL